MNKKTFKLFSKLLISCLLISFFIPSIIPADAAIEIRNPLGRGTTLWDLIDRIIDFIFTISLSVGAILFIFAGYRFVTAAGDPEKIKTAKQMVLWTVIGLMVIISAKGIINFVVRDILNVP